MSDLKQKHCKPCEGGVCPIPTAEAKDTLTEVPGWDLNEAGTEIERIFNFKNYYETVSFVNAVAWIAHREDHHPDIAFGYKRCTVRYSTHAIGGLSENDFICAAKVNDLIGD
jgi:4a-hydroxytetrahydrobiopterin dehydratase